MEALLYIGTLALTEMQASGYTIHEDVPQVAGTVVTASGLSKRSYRKMPVTTIKTVLDNMSAEGLKAYLGALSVTHAVVKFYSLKRGGYREGEFYIDLTPVTVIALGKEPITDGYTLTLTQKGEITDV